MKAGRILRWSVVIFCLLPALLVGQYERPGSAAAPFLKIGVSPRAVGMGDAYIAVARGAEAAYYNPSALALMERGGISASHNDWFAGIDHDFLAAAYNFGRYGAFGFSMTSFRTEPMRVRTPLEPQGTGETFFVNNYRMGLSYARKLTDHVSFGGNLHFINMTLSQQFTERAYAADISTLYVTNFRDFSFGMRIANFGSSLTFVSEQYPLPLVFEFGLAMNAIQSGNQVVMTSLNARAQNDGKTLLSGGLEWKLFDHFFLRGGYYFNHEAAQYSLGSGVRMDIAGYDFGFHYAYSSYVLLGGAHRFGLNITL